MFVLTWLLYGLAPNPLLAPAAADALAGVAPDVRERIQQDGSARVIVELALPVEFVPEGFLSGASMPAQRSDISAAAARVLARLVGRSHRVLHRYATVPFVALEIGADALPELEASPHVRRVVQDTLNEPLLSESVPLIQGDQLWARGADGSGITVAILDTGVDSSHPFLAGKVVEEACFSTTAQGSVSLCPGGVSRRIGPGSAVPCPISDCWHGTHVAGIAAGNGTQAGQSFSGVAKNATIMAIQIFSRFDSTTTCGGSAPCVLAYTSDIVAGLEQVYAVRALHNIASVNLSLGGGMFTSPCDGEPEKPMIDNLRSVGIATVIAAGNDAFRSALSAPGCISSAVSVGSTTKTGVLSSFSNVSSFLSVLAPGGSIVSSVPGGGYSTASGTSMATPHVTGAFALLKQADPGVTVTQTLTALQQTGALVADQRSGGTVTKPLIRASQALSMLLPPTVSTLSPASGGLGATLTTTIGGAMFAPGATASFGAGVTVNSVTFASTQQLTVNVTVVVNASPGVRTVSVTNPGGASGALSSGFTVQAAVPDLIETLGTVPATVITGGSFSVTDTARNQGTASAGSSTTRYYLSLNTVKGVGDVQLAGTRVVPALAAGALSTGSTTLTVPIGVVAGPYFVLACADDLNAVAESNEANNCAASLSALQVTTSPADLVITAVGNPPATALLAASFTITDTVVNRGGSTAGASTTRYYLSTDTSRGSTDVALKGARSVLPLLAGGSSTGTVTVSSASLTPPGVYYVLACADDTFAVAESNEANNCTGSATTMTLTAPDLVETAVSASPSTVAVGGTIAVSDTVTNQGNGAAGTSFTRYFLSVDQVKGGGDISVGVRAIPLLGPQATSTGTVTIALPASLAPGTYYLFACADDNQNVYESAEQNNCRKAASPMVIGTSVPDLIESGLSSPPPTVSIGSSFLVTETVTNQGSGSAAPSTTRYYLSTDALKNAGDVLLTGSRAIPTLTAGATSTGSVTLTVPAGVGPGAYFLIACADDLGVVAESNEGNNCVAAGTALLTAASPPDLVTIAVSNPPSTVPIGVSFLVTDTVTNRGGAPSAASLMHYFLSSDAVRNGGDILLKGSRAVPALAAGASSTGTTSVSVAASTAPGLYYVLACADDLLAVVESNEANNCMASTQVLVTAPDLVETSVSNPPASLSAGATFSVTDTVRNLGTAPAGSFFIRYYLSTDRVKSAGDIVLEGSRSVAGLAVGASSSATATVSVPAGTPAGVYYVLACADDTQYVYESNEVNNCLGSSVQVPVGP